MYQADDNFCWFRYHRKKSSIRRIRAPPLPLYRAVLDDPANLQLALGVENYCSLEPNAHQGL